MEPLDRIRTVLAAEADTIRRIAVDENYLAALEQMRDCEGRLVTTGMGKAGHIAHKFAATLSSTGSPAVFMHPGEAAHGDLGMMDRGDCVIAFSTSGKSREVIEALELARHFGIHSIIGITSHPDSTLRDLADVVLDMGEITEPCPLGLTPSASIAAMLAISDGLALALMEMKNISRADYGLRHHGGYLGRAARTDNL